MAIKKIDLAQQYTNDMPRFPGVEAPHIELLAVVEQYGFGMERFQMTTHLGTHTDFGAHIAPRGKKRQDYTPGDLILENLTRLLELPDQVELVIGAINIRDATGIPSAIWAKFDV